MKFRTTDSFTALPLGEGFCIYLYGSASFSLYSQGASKDSSRDTKSGYEPLWGLEAAGLEAAGVIVSTISSCSSLTSVGAVLLLYKAGGGPGTDPVLPKASSARPRGQRVELHLALGRHSDNL